MIDWIKTAHGVAAIVAAVFATMVAWWNLGTGMVDVTPGDYFDVLALRPPHLPKNVVDKGTCYRSVGVPAGSLHFHHSFS